MKQPPRGWLWIPSACQHVRAVLVIDATGVGAQMGEDAQVRAACAAADVAILLTNPSPSALFDVANGADRILEQALADAARLSGYDEIATAPLLTAGHSTSGIFCRNVAYWKPERVVAVFHIKSGNIAPPKWKPEGDLAGVPFLCLNGQHEEFGPDSGIDAQLGLETQWQKVAETLRAQNPKGWLGALYVEPGRGHFGWSDQLAAQIAAYLPAVMRLRAAPDGVRPLTRADGWLYDPATGASAAAAAFTGDRATAWWFPDALSAAPCMSADAARQAAKDQCVTVTVGGKPTSWDVRDVLRLTPDADGLFALGADHLATYPAKHPWAGRAVEPTVTSPQMLVLRGAVAQPQPGRFRVMPGRWPPGRIIVAAYHAGGDGFRPAEHVKEFRVPATLAAGAEQTVQLPELADRAANAPPQPIAATASSGLPVALFVRSGPARIVAGQLVLEPIPPRAALPITVTVVGVQYGRAGKDQPVRTAQAERLFRVTAR